MGLGGFDDLVEAGGAPSYRFGEFRLDCTTFTLTHAGHKRPIGPKVFDVLRYLVEHRDRLVSKQELLDAIWADQCVEEVAVPWAISHARRALRQRGSRTAPIETIYGRGYRFTAEVECVQAPPFMAAEPMDVAGAGDPVACADYARVAEVAQLAGTAALQARSYADAARFYRWAVEAQAHDGGASDRARADLVLLFARAQWLAQGRGGRSGVPDEHGIAARLVDLGLRHGYHEVMALAAR
ncbi:MAG: transcriptional regulator, partial [Myxococcales bacterium]|nr:transcriptional regulator [Myxococcales bacterium]